MKPRLDTENGRLVLIHKNDPDHLGTITFPDNAELISYVNAAIDALEAAEAHLSEAATEAAEFADRLDALKAERDALRAELAELTKLKRGEG